MSLVSPSSKKKRKHPGSTEGRSSATLRNVKKFKALERKIPKTPKTEPRKASSKTTCLSWLRQQSKQDMDHIRLPRNREQKVERMFFPPWRKDILKKKTSKRVPKRIKDKRVQKRIEGENEDEEDEEDEEDDENEDATIRKPQRPKANGTKDENEQEDEKKSEGADEDDDHDFEKTLCKKLTVMELGMFASRIGGRFESCVRSFVLQQRALGTEGTPKKKELIRSFCKMPLCLLACL